MWLSVVKTFTTSSEWPTGNGRSTRALMIPKTVVFAPIPRTRARKATIEKAGYLKSIRIAKLRSVIIGLLGTESDDGIDARSAARRNPRSEEGSGKEKRADAKINSRIDALYFEEQALQCSRKRKGAEQTNRRSDQKQLQTVRKNERADLSRARAKCQSNTD